DMPFERCRCLPLGGGGSRSRRGCQGGHRLSGGRARPRGLRGKGNALLSSRAAFHDLDLLLALGDLQFGDSRLFDEVDQFFQLSQVHAVLLPTRTRTPVSARFRGSRTTPKRAISLSARRTAARTRILDFPVRRSYPRRGRKSTNGAGTVPWSRCSTDAPRETESRPLPERRATPRWCESGLRD